MYEREFTVFQLNSTVKDVLYGSFPGEFWVRGVVAGVKQASGRGHSYFQLADPSPAGQQPPAVVDCALFAGDRAAIAVDAGRQGFVFDLRDNVEVRLRARVNFWERSGRFQIVIKGVDHTFSGDSAAIHLKKLVEKLSAEGVLQENGTLEFPILPLTLGLVTAKGSAAERDFMKTLEESEYPFRVYARWASMQGSDTAETVCAAFTDLLMSGASEDIDAVVLTRGGGSQTDLAWFNDERIARTIAQLPWPVISAIGHEVDTTLPDHAAHTRAKTPTRAASLLVDKVAAFDEAVSGMSRGLVSAFAPRVGLEKLKLDNLAERLKTSLKTIPERKRSELQRIASGITVASVSRLRLSEKELTDLENATDVRNPAKMMKLGWAVIRDAAGKTVKTAAGVTKGDRLSVSMHDGSLKVLVEEREK